MDRAPVWIVGAVLAGSVTGWSMGGVSPWVLYIPWALSTLVFGLPHGACDHVIWASMRGAPLKFLPVLAGYLAVMGIYAVLWAALPALSAAIFIGMTIWHWGSADATRSFQRAASRLQNTRGQALPAQETLPPQTPAKSAPLQSAPWYAASILRGILPMAGPLALHADVVVSIVANWSPGIEEAYLLTWIPSSLWVSIIVLAGQLGWLIVMYRQGASMKEELGETLLLTLLLLLVHPLVSVGVYFTFWHAWYHDRRLGTWYRSSAPGLLGRSKRLDQIIIMIITLVGLAAMLLLLPPGRSTLSVYLVAISIMTMPHIIVVWLMDRHEGRITTLPPQRPEAAPARPSILP